MPRKIVGRVKFSLRGKFLGGKFLRGELLRDEVLRGKFLTLRFAAGTLSFKGKGSLQIYFLEKFGNLAQPGRPPPSPKVGTPKTKKKIDVYFAF